MGCLPKEAAARTRDQRKVGSEAGRSREEGAEERGGRLGGEKGEGRLEEAQVVLRAALQLPGQPVEKSSRVSVHLGTPELRALKGEMRNRLGHIRGFELGQRGWVTSPGDRFALERIADSLERWGWAYGW